MSYRLSTTLVKSLNQLATGRTVKVVSSTMLESALDRPDNYQHYTQDTNPHRLAAEVAYGIIMNHPFEDGNKRTAFLAANELLRQMKVKPFVNKEPPEVAKNISRALQKIDDAHEQVAQNMLDAEGLAEVYSSKLG